MTDDTASLIRRYRLSKGLTRPAAAAAWGISADAVRNYEARGPGRTIDGLLASALRDALGDAAR